MRRAILSVITLITTVAFAGTAMAGHHLASEQPTVGNLKWMTGSWAGDIGGPTLEENWTQAKAGSIASLVRITSPEGTAMVEICQHSRNGRYPGTAYSTVGSGVCPSR